MFSEELLVVDLDGTLIQSDMLHESFWSAFSKNWLHLFFAMLALGRGKAALKEYLCSKSDIDYRTLPYNLGVIAFIKQHRKQGGRTALVTATHQVFARHIAEHLGLFDEVYGSDGCKNLKGPAKATFLLEKFGNLMEFLCMHVFQFYFRKLFDSFFSLLQHFIDTALIICHDRLPGFLQLLVWFHVIHVN